MRDAALVLLLVSALILGPAAAGATDTAGAVSAELPAVAPAETSFVVDLRPNGDAHWTVRTEYALDDENESDAFGQYAQSYVDGEISGPVSASLFRATAAAASDATDREMAVQQVRRSSSVGEETGTLTLEFVWTNFLERVDSDEYVLGDALYIPENETWLRALEPDQTLVVRTPPGYAINTTSFPVLQQNRSVILNGPWSFRQDGELRISYTEATGPLTPSVSPTPTTSTTPPVEQSPPWAVAIFAVLLGAGAVGGWFVLSRRDDDGDDDGGVAAESAPSPEGQAEPAPEPADDSRTPDADAEAEAEPESETEPDPEPEPEPELLSDEERVVRLLERNGGRMRQADIVKETGWSDAKVSQLLSAMDDEDQVDKLRLGRENLISLPDYEHDAEN